MEGEAGSAAAGTPAAAAAAGGEPWFKGVDADISGYITNRGLDKLSARDAALASIKAHRAAEEKLGAPADRLLRIPTDPNDAEGFNKIHTALGKPGKAEDYDFTAFKDEDESFLGFARDWAFKHNLSKAAGAEFVKDISEWASKLDAAEAQEAAVALNAERSELQKSWGFNQKANLLTVQNTAAKLGIPREAVAALEKAAGYKVTMEALLKIGQAIGEDTFVTSEHTGEVMTAGGAKQKIAELKADKEWVKRYNNGGTKSQEFRQMQDLIRLANGQEPVQR